MKNDLRRRALRTIAGSLASSDFTATEIKAIASTLRTERSFADDLSQLCIGIADALAAAMPDVKSAGSTRRDPWVNKAYRLIQRKRLSKRELLHAIQRLPLIAPDGFADKRTTIEILEYVRQHVPKAASEKFLSQLGAASDEGDPFLEGILKPTREE